MDKFLIIMDKRLVNPKSIANLQGLFYKTLTNLWQQQRNVIKNCKFALVF